MGIDFPLVISRFKQSLFNIGLDFFPKYNSFELEKLSTVSDICMNRSNELDYSLMLAEIN